MDYAFIRFISTEYTAFGKSLRPPKIKTKSHGVDHIATAKLKIGLPKIFIHGSPNPVHKTRPGKIP